MLSLETLHRLSSALNVSLAEFFSFKETKNEAADSIERRGRYLAGKRLEHIQFADHLIRQIIERLETESPQS